MKSRFAFDPKSAADPIFGPCSLVDPQVIHHVPIMTPSPFWIQGLEVPVNTPFQMGIRYTFVSLHLNLTKSVLIAHFQRYIWASYHLVGGFNPSENYESLLE